MDVSIIVATYGGRVWDDLANAHAMPSAKQHNVPVIRHHSTDLASSRNEAADRATSEWLCFLDADDTLAPGYFEAMSKACGDLRAPAMSFVTDHNRTTPVTLDDRDIINGLNPCCIGTLIRRELFWEVGGFWGEPAWEDWSLFRRAALIGARIEHVPGAVYEARMRTKSRNKRVKSPQLLYQRIVSSHNVWLRDRQGQTA